MYPPKKTFIKNLPKKLYEEIMPQLQITSTGIYCCRKNDQFVQKYFNKFHHNTSYMKILYCIVNFFCMSSRVFMCSVEYAQIFRWLIVILGATIFQCLDRSAYSLYFE
jgi:hypothetical protein